MVVTCEDSSSRNLEQNVYSHSVEQFIFFSPSQRHSLSSSFLAHQTDGSFACPDCGLPMCGEERCARGKEAEIHKSAECTAFAARDKKKHT